MVRMTAMIMVQGLDRDVAFISDAQHRAGKAREQHTAHQHTASH